MNLETGTHDFKDEKLLQLGKIFSKFTSESLFD
jgi:hypothetical protein